MLFLPEDSTMIVSANGIRLHVENRGSGAPSLLFLHYWGGSSRTWRHVTAALAADFRTVALDQRGWGRSDKPDEGYALADLAGDAAGVIATLGLERTVLVGHSMGGKVAQLLASARPGWLAGLVLVAPSPPSRLELPIEMRQGMVQAYDNRESVVATVNQVLAGTSLSADDLEMVVADSLQGCRAAREAWPLRTSQEDITVEAGRIDVPTLVISGQDDRVDPPSVLQRELLPRIAHAEMHLLPGVGHLSPLEAPNDIAALIRAFAISIANG